MDQDIAVSPSSRRLGRAPSLPQTDLYGPVHKGLRRLMVGVLERLGATDLGDETNVRSVAAEVRAALEILAGHARHESAHVHPAVERRRAGAMARLERDHEAQGDAIAELLACVARFEEAPAAERRAEGRRMYLRYSAFVGENLVHMAEEEELAQPMLEELYAPEELHAIHAELLASIEPEEKFAFMRFMLPAVDPRERAALFAAVLATFPLDRVATLVTGMLGKIPEPEWHAFVGRLMRAA
jgi:hypothetical protein